MSRGRFYSNALFFSSVVLTDPKCLLEATSARTATKDGTDGDGDVGGAPDALPSP
jgi:hypothetical protein